MDEQIWNFARNGELLEIRRSRTDDGFLLGVQGDGPPRTYSFRDFAKLEEFQADFEKFLLGTGWLFMSFTPERRSGLERRHFSRLISDRRRWWTDGLRTPATSEPSADQDEGARPRRLRRLRGRSLR